MCSEYKICLNADFALLCECFVVYFLKNESTILMTLKFFVFFAVLSLLCFFMYLNTGHELQKLFKNCWLPLDSSDLDEFGGSDEFGETDGCGEYEDSGNFGHLVSIWWLWWVS